jgi:hypothetical protein
MFLNYALNAIISGRRVYRQAPATRLTVPRVDEPSSVRTPLLHGGVLLSAVTAKVRRVGHDAQGELTRRVWWTGNASTPAPGCESGGPNGGRKVRARWRSGSSP